MNSFMGFHATAAHEFIRGKYNRQPNVRDFDNPSHFFCLNQDLQDLKIFRIRSDFCVKHLIIVILDIGRSFSSFQIYIFCFYEILWILQSCESRFRQL